QARIHCAGKFPRLALQAQRHLFRRRYFAFHSPRSRTRSAAKMRTAQAQQRNFPNISRRHSQSHHNTARQTITNTIPVEKQGRPKRRRTSNYAPDLLKNFLRIEFKVAGDIIESMFEPPFIADIEHYNFRSRVDQTSAHQMSAKSMRASVGN